MNRSWHTIISSIIPLITFLRPGLATVKGEKEIKYFVEEGTVEFSNNTLIILSSTIKLLENIKNVNLSKMIDDAKNQLNKDDISDKQKYIISHKIDTLVKINQ